MRHRFGANISATTVQLVLNQLGGFLIFYILSDRLSKAEFGELNWTLSIFLTLFSLLSFGIDQMIIRKIVLGIDKALLLSTHLMHVLISGSFFYLLLLATSYLFPAFFQNHEALLLIGAGKLLLFFSTPFKTLVAGEERFKLACYMSITSTLIKAIALLFLLYNGTITFYQVITIFIIADFSELLMGQLIIRRSISASYTWQFNWRFYLKLLRESIPQMGIVVFSSALARADWILIGLYLSASELAEYSFAYKAFEFSYLPLLVIAPLLVPFFTRLLQNNKAIVQEDNVQLLLRLEMIIACLTALCLNIIWNPVIDNLTGGKYGDSNTTTIFLLSLSLPVIYLNNFLWSIHFSQGNLKTIFHSFLLCFVLNFTGNILLIPLVGNEGAAFSYLLSIVVQTIYYSSRMQINYTDVWQPLLFCSACAIGSGIVSATMALPVWWILFLAIGSYFILLFCTIRFQKKDWLVLKQTINW